MTASSAPESNDSTRPRCSGNISMSACMSTSSHAEDRLRSILGSFDRREELAELQRLAKNARGAELQGGGQHVADAALPAVAHHDEPQVGPAATHVSQQFETVSLGHVHIAHDHIDAFGLQHLKGV